MSVLKSFLFSIRTTLGNYPKLFFSLYGLRKRNKNLLINNQTELVISAYPRTANTFFVVALEHIQKKTISIAHHLHVPALAMEGIKRNLPVVVLVRTPKESIVSLIIREKHISINQAIKAYIKFHEPLLNYKKEILVVDFSVIVGDFPSIISDINSKFCLELNNYSEDNPINKEVIFSKIEKINKSFNKNKLIESMVSRPSDSRDELKKHYFDLLEQKKYSEKLNKCKSIYENLISQ